MDQRARQVSRERVPRFFSPLDVDKKEALKLLAPPPPPPLLDQAGTSDPHANVRATLLFVFYLSNRFDGPREGWKVPRGTADAAVGRKSSLLFSEGTKTKKKTLTFSHLSFQNYPLYLFSLFSSLPFPSLPLRSTASRRSSRPTRPLRRPRQQRQRSCRPPP